MKHEAMVVSIAVPITDTVTITATFVPETELDCTCDTIELASPYCSMLAESGSTSAKTDNSKTHPDTACIGPRLLNLTCGYIYCVRRARACLYHSGANYATSAALNAG